MYSTIIIIAANFHGTKLHVTERYFSSFKTTSYTVYVNFICDAWR